MLVGTLAVVHQPAIMKRSQPCPADRDAHPAHVAHGFPRQNVARVHQVHDIRLRNAAQDRNEIAVRRDARAHTNDPHAIDGFGALDETEVRRFGLPVCQGKDLMTGAYQRLPQGSFGPVAKMATDAAKTDDQDAHMCS